MPRPRCSRAACIAPRQPPASHSRAVRLSRAVARPQVGIRCVKLDGGMSLEQRNRVIATFSHDPDVVVFLMSLKAGGVALNLTAASHVMLM